MVSGTATALDAAGVFFRSYSPTSSLLYTALGALAHQPRMAPTYVSRILSALIPILSLACYPILLASAAPADGPSAASFYIPTIPFIHQNPEHPLTMYGGHLSADPDIAQASPTDVTAHLYFFMVKNRRTADKERLLFWFNGGPGCSSFDGAMMEVGPWRWDTKTDHDFFVKEGGWEEYTTVVFIDQPAGTGFSYTSTDKYVHTIEEAQKHMIEFLKNWYKVFPEYKHVDTYLAGESFAGQWIPYYADAILSSNLAIPLKGAAIGNGWIDSKQQYPAYLDFAVKNGMIEDKSENWKKIKSETDDCVAYMETMKTNPMTVDRCQPILQSLIDMSRRDVNGKQMCVNIYDVRLEDTAPACGMNWPPEISHITTLLGRSDVVSALHATAHPGGWVECRGDVHRSFHERTAESSITVIPRVLSKIPILIFAGDQDIICNHIGLENMIKSLTWNGETGLGTVQTQSWTVNGAPAGTWIFNASHMAPFDLPHVTHDMVLRFMGVNFTAIVDGSAKIPSAIGTDAKPIFVEEHEATPPATAPAKTPQQDKAMWEAYYNAGSAALVLLLVFLIIGTFVWCRLRRKRVQLPLGGQEREQDEVEESIPLTTSMRHEEEDTRARQGKGKGKGRSEEPESPIFEVGDSDEDDYKHTSR
ncbi:hypothetical protein D9619_000585 [Psilocybe cf. subviscida]|uniref:Pheromone-processing carboxypeptidase KEX1 n=1 Tax=Psilocybe cf. subviscida TaxID=2480587 RepID=A0A8H5F2Z6_9AGAR|nr:hypothetical protein D9619_000585 [Psilocybe cf. subviscida]